MVTAGADAGGSLAMAASEPPSSRSMTALMKNLALAAAAILVAVIIGEAFLRLIGFSYPLPYRIDPVRGKVGRAHAVGVWAVEGNARFRFNAFGFRDAPRTLEKAPDVLRLAVLGDSFTEALQVNDDQTYTRLLEQRLNGCFNRPVEVLNFGIGGYGQANQLLTLRHAVLPFKPDGILLLFYPGNDVADNYPPPSTPDRVAFRLRDSRLVEDRSYLERAWRNPRTRRLKNGIFALSDRSRALQLLIWAYGHLGSQQWAGPQGESPQSLPDPEADPPNPVLQSPAWQEAWTVTEALITEMDRIADGRAIPFWISVVPEPGRVLPPDAPDRPRLPPSKESPYFQAEARLSSLAERRGMRFIPLREALADYAERTRTYLAGFSPPTLGRGHWNTAGHRAAAETLARSFCRQPWT